MDVDIRSLARCVRQGDLEAARRLLVWAQRAPVAAQDVARAERLLADQALDASLAAVNGKRSVRIVRLDTLRRQARHALTQGVRQLLRGGIPPRKCIETPTTRTPCLETVVTVLPGYENVQFEFAVKTWTRGCDTAPAGDIKESLTLARSAVQAWCAAG